MLLLKNATVYPQTEKAPFVGDVLCENGRIKEIGKDLSADDAETIDLTGLNLLPGIVDCHSHAGLGPNGDVATLSYCTDTANPVSPEMDVIYAADPTNGCYRWAIENGVTTLGILPGSCDVIDGTGFARTRIWNRIPAWALHLFWRSILPMPRPIWIKRIVAKRWITTNNMRWRSPC